MGKVILVVLLFLLVLVILLLLCPVCYTLQGKAQHGKYSLTLDAYILLGLIHFASGIAGKEVKSKIKLLGIPIIKKTNKLDIFSQMKKKKVSKKNIKKAKVKKRPANLKELIKEIKETFKNSVSTVGKTYGNIKTKYQKLVSKETKHMIDVAKELLIRLLKHVRPRKIKSNLHFGFSQPHLTGQALGYIALGCKFFGLNPEKLNITPDFDNKILEGNIKMKGRVSIVLLLKIAWKAKRNIKF